tara:strand:- start:13413 stop:13649 length:237 start_codon:yes stop_codon:yes gene_type:complete
MPKASPLQKLMMIHATSALQCLHGFFERIHCPIPINRLLLSAEGSGTCAFNEHPLNLAWGKFVSTHARRPFEGVKMIP